MTPGIQGARCVTTLRRSSRVSSDRRLRMRWRSGTETLRTNQKDGEPSMSDWIVAVPNGAGQGFYFVGPFDENDAYAFAYRINGGIACQLNDPDSITVDAVEV